MRLAIVGVGLLAIAAASCASSTKLENEARIHSLRADAAAQSRDYNLAAQEKQEAQRLHEKAVEKALKEGKGGNITVPGDVPYNP